MSDSVTPEQALQAIFDFTAEQLHQGRSSAGVERKLVERGVEPAAAKSIVANLKAARANAIREARSEAYAKVGTRAVIVGGLWFLGGVTVTLLTYDAAVNSPQGGGFLVAWGAILYGGLRLVRGIALLAKADADEDQAST